MDLYTFVYSGRDGNGDALPGLRISPRLFSTKEAAQQASEEYADTHSSFRHKQFAYASVVLLSSVK